MIYHCTEERLYTGRRGRGAFCNGQRLRVSGETGGPCSCHAFREAVVGISYRGPVSSGTARPWWAGRRASLCLSVDVDVAGSLQWALSVLLSPFIPNVRRNPATSSRVVPVDLGELARPRAESEAYSGPRSLLVTRFPRCGLWLPGCGPTAVGFSPCENTDGRRAAVSVSRVVCTTDAPRPCHSWSRTQGHWWLLQRAAVTLRLPVTYRVDSMCLVGLRGGERGQECPCPRAARSQ